MRSILIIVVLLLSGCVSEPRPSGFKDKDDFDQIEAAKTRISLGLTYLNSGNYSQAKFNLDKALEFAPRLADAHFSIAYYYQKVGELELAEESYQEAIDRAPKNPDIANSYGAFLCQNGKYQKAKKYFLKAVNSTNYISTAETYENLALCSQSQGEIDDAITYLQSAINHQPSRGKSLLLLTRLQVQQQQWLDAKKTLKRYEKVARVTPDTLWLSIEIERGLENTKLVQGYGDMLIRMYPTHPNTLDYIKNRDRFVNPQMQVNKVLRIETKETIDTEQQIEVEAVKKVIESADNKQTAYHVVERGENLSQISLRYNIRMQRLIEWNQLENSSEIYAGKKIYVVDPETVK